MEQQTIQIVHHRKDGTVLEDVSQLVVPQDHMTENILPILMQILRTSEEQQDSPTTYGDSGRQHVPDAVDEQAVQPRRSMEEG